MKKLNRTREDPDPLPQQQEQLFSVSRKFLFVSFSFHLTVAPVREKRARQSRRKKNPIGQEIGVTLLPSLPPHRHLASVPATSLPPRHLTTSSPPRCLCATKSSPPHCHLAASVLPSAPLPRHLLATSSQPSRNLLATSSPHPRRILATTSSPASLPPHCALAASLLPPLLASSPPRPPRSLSEGSGCPVFQVFLHGGEGCQRCLPADPVAPRLVAIHAISVV